MGGTDGGCSADDLSSCHPKGRTADGRRCQHLELMLVNICRSPADALY